MRTKHIVFWFSVLAPAACGEPPTITPNDTSKIGFVSPVGAELNATVPPETPVEIQLQISGDADGSRARLSVDGEAVGNGLSYSRIFQPGSHTLQARLLSRDGSKAIDSSTHSFAIRADTLAVDITACRTQFLNSETAAFTVSCFPATVHNPRGYPMTSLWTLDGAPITVVDGRFEAGATLPVGQHTLRFCASNTARNLNACDQAAFTVTTPPTLAVRLHGIEPTTVQYVSGKVYLFAHGSATSPTDSADTGADGRATFPMPADSFAVAARDNAGRYLPMFTRTIKRSEVTSELALVLLVENWAIAEGSFQGNTVAINIEKAAALSPGDDGSPSYRSLIGRTWTGKEWRYRTATWPKSKRPVPVAFDRAASDAAITAQDSAAFWQNTLSTWRNIFAIDMFRPANIGEIPGQTGVRVSVDARVSGGFGDASTLKVDDEGWPIYSGDYVAGTMQFSSPARFTTRTAPHEEAHVAGFGHTCEWVSIVTFCAATLTDTVTKEDVAYVQAFYRLGDLRSELAAPYDMVVATIRGERFLKKNLPAEFPPP